MRRLVLVLCGAAVLASTAAASTPAPIVVQGNTKIGTYRVQANGRLAGALRAFGQPTSRVRHPQHGMCVVRWARLGLRIAFYNLADKNPCLGATGFFGSAVMTGPRWRTSAGLRIGAALSAVRTRHPAARDASEERGAGWWWLVERVAPIGTNGLEAKIFKGRVTQFRETHQAGGE